MSNDRYAWMSFDPAIYGDRGTQFAEERMSGVSNFTAGNNSIIRNLWVKGYEGWFGTYLHFLGYTDITETGIAASPYWFDRKIPHRHPDIPFLVADSISNLRGEPGKLESVPAIDRLKGRHEGPDGSTAFTEYKCAVRYSQKPYQILTNAELVSLTGTRHEATLARYCETKMLPVNRFEKTPAISGAKWVTPQTTDPVTFPATANMQFISANLPMLLPAAEVTLTWYQVPAHLINWPAIDSCVGGINYDVFGSKYAHPLHYEFPRGTLLCLRPEVRYYPYATYSVQSIHSTDMPILLNPIYADITFRFRYEPNISTKRYIKNNPAFPNPYYNAYLGVNGKFFWNQMDFFHISLDGQPIQYLPTDAGGNPLYGGPDNAVFKFQNFDAMFLPRPDYTSVI